MIEREKVMENINKIVDLLREFFIANDIPANYAAAAMEVYIEKILTIGLKEGKISLKQAEELLTKNFHSKMQHIKHTLEGQ